MQLSKDPRYTTTGEVWPVRRAGAVRRIDVETAEVGEELGLSPGPGVAGEVLACDGRDVIALVSPEVVTVLCTVAQWRWLVAPAGPAPRSMHDAAAALRALCAAARGER